MDKDRPSSTKYKVAPQTAHQSITTETHAINTYNKDTDNNIFALGDAASQLENLDDLFSDVGFNLTQLLKDGPPPEITTTQYRLGPDGKPISEASLASPETIPDDISDVASTTASENTEAEDRKSTVKVSTITKQMADGRTVHTRVIQGPVRTKKRIIKISRETADGNELLTEMEVPAEGDLGAIMATIPEVLRKTGRKVSSGEYDNLPEEFQRQMDAQQQAPEPQPTQPDPMPTPEPEVVLPPRENSTSPLLGRSSSRKKSSLKRNRSVKRPAYISTETELGDIAEQNHIGPSSPTGNNCKPPGSAEDASLRARRISLFEDAIQPYEPAEFEEMVCSEEESPVCFSCCSGVCWRVREKGKNSVPKTFSEMSKGRSGMTASEINTDDCLPGPQALIANYARMLYTNRPFFVETLFRSVKLNNLDVTRILCKIVQKSGFKLSMSDFREPASSATMLHVALLYNHTEIIDFLLQLRDTELILARYETEEYRNQTCLHVAVANGNPQLVEKLLLVLEEYDRAQLINSVADGHYFRTQHSHGQLCLTAAAWAGSGEVIKILVKHGGFLGLKNTFGNTVLHSLILQSVQHPDRHDYVSLFECIWEATGIWAENLSYETRIAQQRALEQKQVQINRFKELLTIRNNDGCTPLALATIKNSFLFQNMINLEKIFKIPQNKLGSIAWVTYDVTDITSFAARNYNKFSVLHILAHSSQHLSRHANLEVSEEDLMEMEPMKAILTCKWGVYRWLYIMWLIVHASYIILFTALTAHTNSCPEFLSQKKPNNTLIDTGQIHRGFAFFLILPIVYIILEVLDLLGTRPYRIQFMQGQNYALRVVKSIRSEWTITGNGPYRLVNMMFSCFTIYWFALYVMQDPNQDMAMAMSLLLGWVFVLFFTRGCRVTCRFSIMIQKMFFRDLIYFLTVYAIVLVGFSFAMNAMFTYSDNTGTTISLIIYDMMNVVTDLDTKQTVDGARHKTFAKLLLIFYAIIAVILLMNMLIAMMNTSYETIRVTRCNLWRQQQLSIMLMIERRFFWWRWLCCKSERDVWRNEDGRCYLDVTMLHTPSYKCV